MVGSGNTKVFHRVLVLDLILVDPAASPASNKLYPLDFRGFDAAPYNGILVAADWTLPPTPLLLRSCLPSLSFSPYGSVDRLVGALVSSP